MLNAENIKPADLLEPKQYKELEAVKQPDYEEFDLKDAYLAHEKLESRQSTGSLLLRVA